MVNELIEKLSQKTGLSLYKARMGRGAVQRESLKLAQFEP